jgi:hypothetical protein
MISMLKNMFRTRTKPVTAIEAVDYLMRRVEALNIPVVADDVDAGYDMAVDEVLDIIIDYRKVLSTPTVVVT